MLNIFNLKPEYSHITLQMNLHNFQVFKSVFVTGFNLNGLLALPNSFRDQPNEGDLITLGNVKCKNSFPT